MNRTAETGANRNSDAGKLDYEGFVSPLCEYSFANYMNGHRKLEDGTLRDSDNWQKSLPDEWLMKSLHRHFMDLWLLHRGYTVYKVKTENGEETVVSRNKLIGSCDGHEVTVEEACNGIRFNSEAYKLNELKR